MRIKVKVVVFETDPAKWVHCYCSYCPATGYFLGRGNSAEDVICDVTAQLLSVLCHRRKETKLQKLGWEISDNLVIAPIFADDEAIRLAEQSYSTKIVEPKIIVVDVEVPVIQKFY